MSFVKNALLSVLVFSAVITGFIYVLGDLNTNYSIATPSEINSSNNTILINEVGNMSLDIRNTMKPSEISSSQTNFLDVFTMGSSMIANTISLIFIGLPKMLYSIVVIAGEAIGLPPWVTKVITTAIGILITFMIMKFILRRSP